MHRIISRKEMADLDMQAQQLYHIPGSVLMENAGLKIWQYLKSLEAVKKSDRHLLFAAGPGNNGGDALVAARHAFEIYPERVAVVSSGEGRSENRILQREIIRSLGIPVLNWPEDSVRIADFVNGASLIVDGISGTGMEGRLRENPAALVSLLNASPAFRAAVDIPSGVTDGFKRDFPCFHADVTLTMGLPKIPLYLPEGRSVCGEIVIINPGFPRDLLKEEHGPGHLYSFEDFELPRIAETAYKSTRGHAAVFAGSAGFTGAAFLSASAAARVRTGLVTLHVDSTLYPSLVSGSRSVMIRPLSGKLDTRFLSSFSAYLAGPGWGMDGSREQYLRVLLESPLSGVVDADGIRHLASLFRNMKDKGSFLNGECIITPHPGELSYFTGKSKETILENPLPLLAETAEFYNLVIVLKSHVTYITAPDGRIGIVDGMNPALGTGGSGDVLAGIIAGFLAQGIPAFEAAVQGVLLHQKAGAVCFEEKGWFLSEDLLPYLSVRAGKGGV